jgi:hypothetical protein
MERDHAKEKQKLLKDKDAGARAILHLFCKLRISPKLCRKAKGLLAKANQTKTKMENLARELQKVRPCPLNIPSLSVAYCLSSRTTNAYEYVGIRIFTHLGY